MIKKRIIAIIIVCVIAIVGGLYAVHIVLKNNDFSSIREVEVENSQEDHYPDAAKASITRDIHFEWRTPSYIDLNGLGKEDVWISTPNLRDCFGYDGKANALEIRNKDNLVTAKLFVYYLPTIWSKEKDKVLQLIDFESLRCHGVKEVVIDYGNILLLEDSMLFDVPDDVKTVISCISKQDLLQALDDSGDRFENENWNKEKKVWQRYIGSYNKGDFLIKGRDYWQFATYPSVFYLQLPFDGKKGRYTKNLCDEVIIGN